MAGRPVWSRAGSGLSQPGVGADWSWLGVAAAAGAVVGPVAAAGHVDVVGGVDDPVQDRFGHDGVREQRVPVLGWPGWR